MELLSGSDPAIRGQSRTERASELARRQFGAIARRQLRALGYSSSGVERWIADGRLHPRYPGVYAFGRVELSEAGEHAAGLLFAGHGSALASLSCLWWRELLGDRPTMIHLDAPGDRRSRADLRIRHPRAVEREWHRGLPVTALPEALLPAAAHLHHDSLRLVLARAEFSGQLSLSSLQSRLGSGRRGSSALRAAMDAHLPQLARCVNGFERDFVLLCERFVLPIPEPNVRIGRFVPDMLWREKGLIAELDGRGAHSTPAQLARDSARQAQLESLGYRVIRFGWAEVTYEAEKVAARVRHHLVTASRPTRL